jgi:hypothetical protein
MFPLFFLGCNHREIRGFSLAPVEESEADRCFLIREFVRF